MPRRQPPQHLRRQAHAARQLAALMSLASDKLILLKMAEDYDRKAAEQRSREQGAPQPPADSKLVSSSRCRTRETDAHPRITAE
jgi:hypothetical protein